MNNIYNEIQSNIKDLLSEMPSAVAKISGTEDELSGAVLFYPMNGGTTVVARITGLPDKMGKCGGGFYAMHIHSGGRCSGNDADPYADAGTHYNPDNCAHPYHAGDLPPLMSNSGFAFSAVFTTRFTADEVIGKTVIIHAMPDDFTTQPSGNSGSKIACGVIEKWG